eukprot:CAMPEP_0202065428 /NCGR_PEP_ID=MMETSP0963-20130614/51574_1 /ASSEMBLY_ACC=CAM_ASM_000494 /TAXON_ID=4773 /ORGANISM="Schizochytrium aggregatum, Strain ATCC28209" /LENGTH=115 /DNA_ID=CAMNT_0048632023 /DNA_START=167 /DNA_END=514 /DNA_ORIENTATION=-
MRSKCCFDYMSACGNEAIPAARINDRKVLPRDAERDRGLFARQNTNALKGYQSADRSGLVSVAQRVPNARAEAMIDLKHLVARLLAGVDDCAAERGLAVAAQVAAVAATQLKLGV